jgi:NAD(P)-dependent dehydrogenase (short-subunit alcohol dehydrogenase family)
MDLGLSGKRVLVTGASRGIGRAVAQRLVGEGAAVAICSRSDEALQVTADKLRADGGTVFAKAVDVTDADALKAFIDEAAGQFGGLDILVSTVSAGSVKGEGQWAASLAADLMPFVNSVDAVTPHLKAAGGGSIVAVSSTFGFDTIWPSSPNSYGAFKAAVIRHASSLGHTLAPQGIRVNTVSPGPIEFEDGDWGAMKKSRPEVYDRVKDSIPVGRMGTGEEISSAIVYLASPAAAYCVGVNLVVDGGMTARVQF